MGDSAGRVTVKRAFILAFATGLLSLLAAPIFGLDVDRDELEDAAAADIEFQNYEGPYEDTDTLDEISGIGSFLADPPLLPGEERDYFNRYRILHAVDPDMDAGLDADILYILEDARVDHIDNVRRILSGYLSAAYGYAEADADLLSELVTIYNAVHRGATDFFEERYKPIVTDNLSAEGAGISTLYSDWPGATELVTPLSEGAAPGQLGAIAPLQLTDDFLIEQLRRRPDMGLEERRALVDFLERVIEERREEIAEEREAIEEERQAIEEAEEAEEPAEEEPAPEEPVEDEAEEETPPEEEPAEEEPAEEDLEQRREDLEEREEELAEEEEEVEELEEEVREQREQIAEDTQDQIAEEEEAAVEEEPEITPVPFLLSRREDGLILRQPVRVQPITGEILVRSPLDTVSSATFVLVNGSPVVVGDYEGQSRLVQLDEETLQVRAFGEAEIAEGSSLVTADGSVYAVVRDGEDWYLGRFDRALELRERSEAVVVPESYIYVAGQRIFAQGIEGSVLSLAREDFGE